MTLVLAREKSTNAEAGPAPTPTIPRTNEALADLNLGSAASASSAAKDIARDAVKLGLLRDSRVEGADGFFAALFKTVGGRESPSSGQTVKGPQLGKKLETEKSENSDFTVKPGGSGEAASVSFSPEFLERIGLGGRVHMLVESDRGLKVFETASRGDDGAFSFSQEAGRYPAGAIILIEPENSRVNRAKAALGAGLNMHIPFKAALAA